MTREQVLERILNPKGPPGALEDRQAFDAWLERDFELREMIEDQQELFSVMDEWRPAEPSLGFDRGVYDRIEAYEGKRNWFERWFGGFRPAMAGAVAMLIVGVMTVLIQRDQPVATPEPAITLVSAEVSAEDEQYLREIDLALDDIEMLADFEAFPLNEAPQGRS